MKKNQKKQLVLDVLLVVMFTIVIGMNLNLKNITPMTILSIVAVTVMIGLLTFKVEKKQLKAIDMDDAYLILRNAVFLCVIVILLLQYIG